MSQGDNIEFYPCPNDGHSHAQQCGECDAWSDCPECEGEAAKPVAAPSGPMDCYICADPIPAPRSFVLDKPWCDTCLNEDDHYLLFEKGNERLMLVVENSALDFESCRVQHKLEYLAEWAREHGWAFKVLGNLDWLREHFVREGPAQGVLLTSKLLPGMKPVTVVLGSHKKEGKS